MIELLKIHNYYEIEVLDYDGTVKSSAKAYNTAYSKNYNASPMIYILRLFKANGGYRENYIEPYLNPDTHQPINEANYWEREGEPSFEGTAYKCVVLFLADGSSGQLTSVQLRGNLEMSMAEFQDIEGKAIYLDYGAGDSFRVTAHIYFETDINEIKGGSASTSSFYRRLMSFYPIKFFNAQNSIFCGCIGRQTELLKVADRRPSREGYTHDGYLPQSHSNQLGISKNPIPLLDDKGFLMGNADNCQLFQKVTEGLIYKNSTTKGSQWKGLITSLVFPGIGLIDLRDSNMGPLHEGILPGNKVTKQNIPDNENGYLYECFIPQEYIKNGERYDSLISITKNAFYNAETITVKRDRLGFIDVVPLDKSYFSDLIDDYRIRRCKSFIQSIPLTDKHWVGAESIIPCGSGDSHRYYIEYGSDPNSNKLLTANYAVTGEVLVKTGFNPVIYKKYTYSYKLEYSYNGNDFFTAIDFSDTKYLPYKKYPFKDSEENNITISAPIWRVSSSMTGMSEPMTTFSDPRISRLFGHIDNRVDDPASLGDVTNGYEHLYMFVGYDSKIDTRQNLTPEEQESLMHTPDYSYENKGSDLPNTFETIVPYLYHANDTIFFSGKIEVR